MSELEEEEERMYRRVFGRGPTDDYARMLRLLNEFSLRRIPFAEFSSRRIPFVLTSEKAAEEASEESVKQKVDSIEKNIFVLEDKINRIEEYLKIHPESKNRALIQFREMLSKIPEVKEVFYKETKDGYDFWTLFKSKDRFKTLQKIVQAQMELDKTNKDIFFDFNVNHIANVDREELEDWKQLYNAD